jgi:hypothetical protein
MTLARIYYRHGPYANRPGYKQMRRRDLVRITVMPETFWQGRKEAHVR